MLPSKLLNFRRAKVYFTKTAGFITLRKIVHHPQCEQEIYTTEPILYQSNR